MAEKFNPAPHDKHAVDPRKPPWPTGTMHTNSRPV